MVAMNDASVFHQILATVHEHGQRSSVLAWARIYEQHGTLWKVIWFILLIGGFAATGWHIHRTVDKYQQSPVSTQTYDRAVATKFPEITICPVTFMPRLFQENPHQSRVIEKLLHLYNFVCGKKCSFRKFRFILLASQDLTGLVLPSHVLIPHCRYYDPQKDVSHAGIPCAKKIRMFRNFGKMCYSITLPDSENVRHLIMYLYTATMSVKNQKITTSNDKVYSIKKKELSYEDLINKVSLEKQQKNGLYISVLQQGITERGKYSIYVDPGKVLDINFVMERHKLHNTPSRHCIETGKSSNIRYLRNFYGDVNATDWGEYVFDSDICKYRDIQTFFYQKCGCYFVVYPSPGRPEEYCHHLSKYPTEHEKTLLKKRWACLIKAYTPSVLKTFIKNCKAHSTCLHDMYTTRVSTTDLLENGLSNVQIADRSFRLIKSVANRYITVPAEQSMNNVTEKIIMKQYLTMNDSSTTTGVINSNFIVVKISRSSEMSTLYVEELTYGFTEVLAEIGGIFGLWCGASLLAFVEIMQLFIAAVAKTTRKSKKGDMINVEVAL